MRERVGLTASHRRVGLYDDSPSRGWRGLEPDSLRHACWPASLHGLHRARSRQAVARALAVPHALLPENMASFDFGSFARSVSGSGAGPVQVSIESCQVSSLNLFNSACRHWPDPLSDHMLDRLT